MSDTGDLQPLITQCPNCGTQFRVNEAQLQIAGGKVRCGACLTVFQGVDALVWEDGADAQADGLAENPTEVLDDLLDELDGDPIGAELTAEERRRLEDEDPAPAADSASAAPSPEEPDSATAPRPPAATAAEPMLPEGVSAKAALAALRRAAPSQTRARATEDHSPSGELDDFELVSEALTETVPDGNRADAQVAAEDNATQPEDGAPNDSAVDLAAAVAASFGTEAGDSAEPAPVRPRAEAPQKASQQARQESRRQARPQARQEADEQKLAREPEPESVRSLDTAVPEDDPFARLSANSKEAPLPEPGAQRGWLLYALAAGGVLLLIAQVLVFQFESWSQNPSTRGIYTALCPAVGCEVPPLKALDRMESRNLSVRSHPDLPEALTVDTVIVNNAEFPQSFPIIELTFTDIDGKVVAGRRFEPEEYLAGELKGAKNIASRTPVRIRLEIRDPGPTAVSYKMDFR